MFSLMNALSGGANRRHHVFLPNPSQSLGGGQTGHLARLAWLPGLACWCLLFCLLGCQTTGPHPHSKEDRDAYAQLPPEERALVGASLLGIGMAKTTVRLAWGNPDKKRTFTEGGKERTEWLYYGTRWVDQPTWEYTYTDRYGSPCLDFRMNRVGIPFLRARAVFKNDRLIDWRRASP